MKESFDILIVGAGASGLAAAISAKRTLPRFRVAMLERLPRVGKKILATGNGRCNLTNLNARSHGYTNREFADSVFEKYDERRVLQFFKSIGLLTYSDSCGRVYPMSNTASGVLDCLRFEAERLGAKSICEDKCEDIKKTDGGFLINGRYRAREIIICTGGCASPSQGSDGSGYKLLSSLGHTVTELYPSLVQLTSPDKQLRQLKGMRVHDAVISAAGRTSRGELLFTDYGLSGIAAKVNTTGTPPGGPKSRKLHYGELVGRSHVSPPNPRIKARFQRAALEPFGVSFFHIFLHAKKDMAVGDIGKSQICDSNPSVTFGDSSLYTREPLECPAKR